MQHICVQNLNSIEGFKCINETPIRLSLKRVQNDLNLPAAIIPQTITTTTTTQSPIINDINDEGDFDACLTGPCPSGTICKPIVEEPGYLCETEQAKQLFDIRGFVRNVFSNGVFPSTFNSLNTNDLSPLDRLLNSMSKSF
jgi:hypothetical protein